jgi:S-adenosylmethionine decarboxylase
MEMSELGLKALMQTNASHGEWAGLHLLIDFWDADNTDSLELCSAALRAAAEACGSTLLDLSIRKYGELGGVSGVGLLAESHISIHTWSEYRRASCDVYVCGQCDPYMCVPVLKKLFNTDRMKLTEIKRMLEFKA